MVKNNDYPTGNLFDYEYFSKHCKLIAIDLGKQIEFENPDWKQQINFIGRIERNEETTMLFIIESQKKQLLNFHKMLQQFFDLYYI